MPTRMLSTLRPRGRLAGVDFCVLSKVGPILQFLSKYSFSPECRARAENFINACYSPLTIHES